MKNIIVIVALAFCFNTALAQKEDLAYIMRENNKNKAEAIVLYRSEMASWNGTDIFMAKYKTPSPNSGYFSYTDSTNYSKCIFYSKIDTSVIYSVAFDSTYSDATAKVDSIKRKFNPLEKQLFFMREKALERVKTDTFFKHYKHTNLNTIPLVENGEKKLYMLTGPDINGVVIFGNDYLLTFDDNYNITSQRRLHHDIIVHNVSPDSSNQTRPYHTHLPSTGDFITSTDICTLLLYEKFTPWENYSVFSDKYVSVWDCKNNILITITKDKKGKTKKGKNKKKQSDASQ